MGRNGSMSKLMKSSASSATEPVVDMAMRYQMVETNMSQSDAREWIEDKITSRRVEYGAIVTSDGKIYMQKGTQTDVDIPWDAAEDDGVEFSSTMVVHNHPSNTRDGRTIGGVPSFSDIFQAAAYKVKDYAVVAKEGTYRVQILGSYNRNGLRSIMSYESAMTTQRYEDNYSKYKNMDDGMDGWLHAAWDETQKQGKKYGFKVTFEPNAGYENLYS